MPVTQPASCDQCSQRDPDNAPPAQYAVSVLQSPAYDEETGTYDETGSPAAATLLCEKCFERAGGPEAFTDGQYQKFPTGRMPGQKP